MHTYHIHINGLVQGVGFRPLVCRLAKELGVTGWVSNTTNGVHIECTASPEMAKDFYNKIIGNPPPSSIITHHHIKEIEPEIFTSFIIRQSTNDSKPDLLLTPDIALCTVCKQELLTPDDRRFHYPFTTCLHCGPRYSISSGLPYDRERTTMSTLKMCDSCSAEYNDIENRRHYSQTNSCKACAIPMHLYNSLNVCLSSDTDEVLNIVIAELNRGSIVAVKGIGGYLLLCDATNKSSINTLRTRKQRPAKPFALLYANVELADGDVELRSFEMDALNEKSAPIVLCEIKSASATGICKQVIAPGLDKIGVMLPYSPLLLLIANAFGRPLIATSGNISGSPIIYKDADALQNLVEEADFVLTFERNIVAPQDDSVIQFTESGQKITLRRSRGLAPNYFPNPFHSIDGSVLAMGSELKSAFALLDQTSMCSNTQTEMNKTLKHMEASLPLKNKLYTNEKNLYISQYLGDQGTLESQTCFKETLLHVTKLVKAEPDHLLIDKHPGYFVSQFGRQIASAQGIPVTVIQHHKAHFGAVLAENNLLTSKLPVLGLIWDGTGYGDDGQIWGGEVFIYQNNEMNRVAHLDYFSQLLGDKMSREPRLSALSLLQNFPNQQFIIQKYFSKQEWQYYQQLLEQPASLLSSSMGRFLDGIAAILGIGLYNTYEGEAAMQMEALARTCAHKSGDFYSMPIVGNCLDWTTFLTELLEDHQQKKDTALISWKVFSSLAMMIEQLCRHFHIDKVAFSGGVFQNALLNDLLIERLSTKRKLYFHQQLSPNDECIGFGQIACFSISNRIQKEMPKAENKTDLKQFEISN
jgi:hydrogenase maturation protein HypF